jgi:hypothetical protein
VAKTCATPHKLFMADRLGGLGGDGPLNVDCRRGRPWIVGVVRVSVDDASAVDLCHLSLAAARGFQPVLRHRQLTL